MKRTSVIFLAAAALCGSTILFNSSPAAADEGLVGWAGKRLGVSGLTDPIDDWNRQLVERSGPNSVYGQINESFWNHLCVPKT